MRSNNRSKRCFTAFAVGLLAFVPATLMAEPWTLRQCIDYAIAHNIEIKRQNVALRESKVNVHTAKSSWLPSVNAGANQSFSFGRVLQADNTYGNRNTYSTGVGLNAEVPLFTGLRNYYNLAYEKLNLQVALAELERAKEDISMRVTEAYLQVLYTYELAGLADEQIQISRQQLATKQAYYDLGKLSQAELLEIKATVARDEMQQVEAKNNCDLAVLALTQLLELQSPEQFTVAAPHIDSLSYELTAPTDIYAAALLGKPAVKAAQYRMAGAEKAIRVAQSGYYPQLNLGGGIGSNYYMMSGYPNQPFRDQMKNNFSKYFQIGLSIPIFNRFATHDRVRLARLQQETATLQFEQVKKELYNEIQKAYYGALAAESKYRTSRVAEYSAEAAFRLMREKYDAGKANHTQFNDSRMMWLKASSDRTQAKYEYLFRTKIVDFYLGKPITL